MPELILGLDVGSTSARALVVGLDGRVHGKAIVRLESSHPGPGRVEQDPRDVWKRVQGTIQRALSEAGRTPQDLAAVGVATQRSSIVVWDRKTGEPVGPMIIWSDLRGTQRAQELEASGFLASPVAAISKLEGAIDAIDRGRERAAAGELAWGTLDSYLVHRLSGGALHVTDYSNAWTTLYLDFATMRNWNEKLIEFQNLPVEFFPTLCDTYGSIGHTTKADLGAEIPIGAIIADQQSGMFAHNALEIGNWKATYGTSAALMIATGSGLAVAPGLLAMLLSAKGDETLFATEGMIITAGSMLDWLVGGLGLFSSIEDLSLAAASVESNGGVAIRPSLQGIGTPYNDSNVRAAIVGLSGASTPAEIARAAFESLALRMRQIVDTAGTLENIDLPEILPVDGGLATNDIFLQIQADLLGRPVARPREIEATAIGACIGAALGVDLATLEDLAPLTESDRVFEPSIHRDEADTRLTDWRKAVDLER